MVNLALVPSVNDKLCLILKLCVLAFSFFPFFFFLDHPETTEEVKTKHPKEQQQQQQQATDINSEKLSRESLQSYIHLLLSAKCLKTSKC